MTINGGWRGAVRVAMLGVIVAALPLATTRVGLAAPGSVDEARLRSADAEPGQWLSKGRDWREQHYSPLKGIDRTSVARLGLAWDYDASSHRGQVVRGLEATPLVVDGVLYTSLAWGDVVALEAATGRERWRYDAHADGAADRKTCCDVVNRGVAVWKGRVYVATVDGYMVSLDARDGRELWRTDTFIDRSRAYASTGAPQIAGDVVVIGNGGSEFGVRGYVSAYDLATGALRWRFYTVPGDPRKGFEHPELAMAAKTWDPDSDWLTGGGGTAWDSMAYDPTLHLLYVGTGNSSPYPNWFRSPKGGDNLFLASILAIDARTGRLAWHYQTTPGEMWDYDATQPFVLADLPIHGHARPVVMQASKNGFFYVLDRANGKLLSAKSFVYVNWASRVDLKTGRPVLTGKGWYKDHPVLVSPSQAGGHNWMPMSYSPDTRLVYLPAIDTPMLFIPQDSYRYQPGAINLGTGGMFPPVPPEYSKGEPKPAITERLIAWDPVREREVWRAPLSGFWNGGVLSTGGGLVFQGASDGHLRVYDDRNGELVKDIEIGIGIMAAPAAYEVAGKEYVAVLVGYGGAMQKAFVPGVVARTYQNQARIMVFALDGGPVALPPKVVTPPLPATPYELTLGTAEIERGKGLYLANCARCHGGFWGDAGSGYPDLTRLAPEKHAVFSSVVLDGVMVNGGMASFRDVLSPADVTAVQEYLMSQTNGLIKAEHQAHP